MADGDLEMDDDLPLEETLLLCSRRGQASIISDILRSRHEGTITVDINCKGQQKSNRGWSPLHLASYFGHTAVVQLLLENGADVNILNNVGDTPLHRAAYTGREDVVMLLLQQGADVKIVNSEGLTARATSRSKDIAALIEAAEKHEERKREEEFLLSVRLGQVDKVDKFVTSGQFSSLNCQDQFGNTPLHLAAQSGQKEVAVYLLQRGVNSAVKNKQGLVAHEVAQSQHMKQLLNVQPLKGKINIPHRFEGLLIKKSTFMGKSPVWGVIERGVISYFRNRGDATTGTKRRGMKYLDEAVVKVSSENGYDFLVNFSDGASHKLGLDPAASRVRVGVDATTGEAITRQRWVNALKEHIAYSTHYLHAGDLHDQSHSVTMTTLQESIQMAQAQQNVLESQVQHMSNYVKLSQNSGTGDVSRLEAELQKTCQYSQDVCSSLNECLSLFTQQQEVRERELHEEREKVRVLQESLHALALEHHELEQSFARGSLDNPHLDDMMFYDCDPENDPGLHCFRRPVSPGGHSCYSDALSFKSCQFDMQMEIEGATDAQGSPDLQAKPRGREKLPVPMFDRNNFSFWSILKQCVGKELSKITMPVVFNEPLSFIQRLAEKMEYSSLLDKAHLQDDPIDRLMYVAAFAVSSMSSNWDRIGKPFNPLLGETYELDREDLGFRLISEQVCHHPPISAYHVEAEHYKFHGSIYPKLKFWGKTVEVSPKGVITLELTKHGESYTWQNVNICVHNVIVGKLWMEHYGVMEVTNHKTKQKVVLNFKQGGWFGKDLHKVEGFVYNADKKKVKALYGSWVYDLFAADIQKYDDFINNKYDVSPKPPSTPTENGSTSSDIEDNIPTHHFSNFNLNIPDQTCIWRCYTRPDYSPSYFNFTNFTMCVNELKDGMLDILPPTDSRRRPDVRILEEGNIDVAGEEKHRLEEKQRAARKERRRKRQEWSPVWFKLATNPVTGKEDWMYVGGYWDRDWAVCPDIF